MLIRHRKQKLMNHQRKQEKRERSRCNKRSRHKEYPGGKKGRKKKRYGYVLKIKEREILNQGVILPIISTIILSFHTHLHLIDSGYGTILHGSLIWLDNIGMLSMLQCSLPKLHISFSCRILRQRKCLGENV